MSVSNNAQLEAMPWQGKNVVVFGAGLSGESAVSRLIPSCNVLAVLDNDKHKSGNQIHGHPIVHPDEFFSSDNTFDLVLIASEYFEKIATQLMNDFDLSQDSVIVLPTIFTKPQLLGDSQNSEKLANDLLAIVSECFTEQHVPYYFDAGTLLGIYRDKQLIPWDDDIDIAVNAAELDAVLAVMNNIKEAFQQCCGETLAIDMLYASRDFGAVKRGDIRGLKLKSLSPHSNVPMMDVFVKYVRGDKMDYVLASRGFTMPSEHLLTLQTARFNEHNVMLPSKPERYLELHYGSDWRVPKKEWNLSMLHNTTVF